MFIPHADTDGTPFDGLYTVLSKNYGDVTHPPTRPPDHPDTHPRAFACSLARSFTFTHPLALPPKALPWAGCCLVERRDHCICTIILKKLSQEVLTWFCTRRFQGLWRSPRGIGLKVNRYYSTIPL